MLVLALAHLLALLRISGALELGAFPTCHLLLGALGPAFSTCRLLIFCRSICNGVPVVKAPSRSYCMPCNLASALSPHSVLLQTGCLASAPVYSQMAFVAVH